MDVLSDIPSDGHAKKIPLARPDKLNAVKARHRTERGGGRIGDQHQHTLRALLYDTWGV